MQFVNLAKELAVRYHAGQRYGEHEYIYHLDNVAQLLEQSYDDRLLVIAYLHDILEDTHCKESTLRELFEKSIVDAVVALTKVKGETTEEYFSKVLSNGLAKRVKMADSLSNLTESVKRHDTKRIDKYVKYLQILNKGTVND